jgi:hypothetical protein
MKKQRQLTRGEVLKRLRDVYQRLEMKDKRLTRAERSWIDYNFSLAHLFCEVTSDRDFDCTEVVGFTVDDEGDDEIDDNVIYNIKPL